MGWAPRHRTRGAAKPSRATRDPLDAFTSPREIAARSGDTMFVARRLNGVTVELWRCQWENEEGADAKKVFVEKLGEEQPIALAAHATEVSAICWS
ncbi:MAG: hypothetical protein KF729_11505 [Sandaracinaceae bacterium]|nr:hypothetical protein [Sandaracinaceae bacterium]